MSAPQKTVSCAIYTRKSTAEGLDQEFNSLDAQRESAEAFIASQRGEGWIASPERYDDGGFTGGNTDRPALHRLMRDIEAGKVGCVVVYKVDRLSRSLLDFAKMMEVFDKHNVAFVAVTQHFNTGTSMGRLILNILLSFAQFEREVIAERIRDKIAMQKARGQHCGGTPPLGYDIVDRKLVVNHAEADTVRHIFQRFAQCGSTTTLLRELAADGYRSKSWTTVKGKTRAGRPFDKPLLYRLLQNRKYIGEIPHRDQVHPGAHEAIVERPLWDKAQSVFASHRHQRANQTRASTPGLLKGILKCGHCGGAMTMSYTRKKGRVYRYYLCLRAAKLGRDACPVKSVAAGDIEAVVAERVRALLRDPEVTAKAAKAIEMDVEPADAVQVLANVEASWDALFPAEQARIVGLLVERADLHPDGLELAFRESGLAALAQEAVPARIDSMEEA